jgi:hypothetical protein
VLLVRLFETGWCGNPIANHTKPAAAQLDKNMSWTQRLEQACGLHAFYAQIFWTRTVLAETGSGRPSGFV